MDEFCTPNQCILNNISDHLRPISCGLIVSREARNISSIIKKLGFIIIDEHVGRVGKYLVAKNNLDKIATVRYYGKNNRC